MSTTVPGTPAQQPTWDDFLTESRPDIGFMQSAWWAEYLATRGWDSFGALVRDGEEILGGARVLSRSYAPGKRFFYAPEGPVLPSDPDDAAQVFQAVLAYVDSRRGRSTELVSHFRIEPRWPVYPPFLKGWRAGGSRFEPRHTLHVDLTASEAAILAQMKPKGRYNIGLARRRGVSVVTVDPVVGIEDFLAIYRETFSRHDLSRERSDDLRSLSAILSACDQGQLHFAEHDGVRLAVALVVRFGDRATYLFGGSRDLRRDLMAPYLLHFEAMLHARRVGSRWYDFYGVAPANRPDHRWANITRFKRQFGGLALDFIPTQDLVFDEAAYAQYLAPTPAPTPARC